MKEDICRPEEERFPAAQARDGGENDHLQGAIVKPGDGESILPE